MNVPAPLPGQVTVRAAAPEDAEIVLAMVGEIAAHQDQAEHVTSSVERWGELLGMPEVTVLIAEVDGHPVGYVSAVRKVHLWSGADLIVLDDLYVRPGRRDHGVGRTLMIELSRRFAGLTITWGVQPDNHAAIRFYERLGATARPKVICVWTRARQQAHEL